MLTGMSVAVLIIFEIFGLLTDHLHITNLLKKKKKKDVPIVYL